MAFPKQSEIEVPLLRALLDCGGSAAPGDLYSKVATHFPNLTSEEQDQRLKGSPTTRKWWNLVQWVRQDLVHAGEIDGSTHGVWKLTEAGRARLTSPGAQPDAQLRIKGKVERAIPDDDMRRSALQFLAYAIENADDERSDGWCMKEMRRGLSLHTGRLQACRIRPNRVEVSVMGPVSDEILAALGADTAAQFDFKAVPGGLVLSFASDKAETALELLKHPFERFVDEAMARVRTSVGTNDHEPEAVAYVARVVERELPQPSETVGSANVVVDDEEDGLAFHDPKVRGRAPIFEHGQRSIGSLVSDIEEQAIALPDLQRPFVWGDTKVRDLLDSLFVGFPVGTLVLWHTSDDKEARAIGEDSDTLKSTSLVIDGQQRLTSLYAVLRGTEVTNKDGSKRRISIAFRPRDGRFEVADAAIRRDPEFLPNITELWQTRSKTQIKKVLLKTLREKGREVDEAYEDAVDENLDRAQSISDYRFPVVDIRKTAAAEEVSEEDVAEIFVRINNQGTRLGQVDFVLTLLSVYHGELRDRIEQRAAELTADPVAALDTRQLLRATCGVAFGRARMQAIYRYLRGMDPVSGIVRVGDRQARLDKLDVAADECIHPTTWQDYTLRVVRAGFVDQSLIASNNAIVNAYTFYVLGQRNSVRKPVLDEFISRWVFATLLSARYSGSSETTFEEDLGRVRDLDLADARSFIRTLDDALSETITKDYWGHTVVAALQTQRRRAPTALAFRAAQVVLGARGLFSDQLLQNLLAPPAKGKRSASEAHHLFPVAWLGRAGITDRKIVNQVANYADLGYFENSTIGARSPQEYVPQLRDELDLDDERWGRMCAEHALPPEWESMDYSAFLAERRERMADLTHVAFRKLGGESEAVPLAPPWFLPGADAVWRRIAETERVLRQAVRDVYTARFGERAPERIESTLHERERETLTRALRSRPSGANPMSVIDYLYLAQLPTLLFANDTQQEARSRLSLVKDAKQRLLAAIEQIAPVRNEIAHVREVSQDRLLRANIACDDVLGMFGQAP